MTEEIRMTATHAIAGFRRPRQVAPILPAAILELTDEDAAEVESSAR
jgi:hypothetical protein